MLIDRGAGEVVAAAMAVGPTVSPSHVLPERAPAAALGDHLELLHVHMHQLARDGPLVTAHDAARRPVHSCEPVHPMPAEGPAHGRDGQTDLRGYARRTSLVLPPELHDPTLEPLISAVRSPSGD